MREIAISAKNLTLGYKKTHAVLKNANFQIHKKDFVFITGASGSGKSTLLKSIYGDSEEISGELIVNNVHVHLNKKMQIRSLRANIGVVFQDYKLIQEWNIEKNIHLPMKINNFPKEQIEKKTKSLLHLISLLHKSSAYPLELSGGEQQRVALARAIAHQPRIILADEPTGNLDDYSSNLIWGLLKSANKQLGITIVVVTHRVPREFDIKHRKLSIQDGGLYEYN